MPLGVEVAVAGSETKPFDTRSFIVSRPQLGEATVKSQQRPLVKGLQAALPRMVQARYTNTHIRVFPQLFACIHLSHVPSLFSSHTSKEGGDSASPKFIVTLDGVPSPLGNIADCEMELDDVRPPTKVTEATVQVNRQPKVSILQRLQGYVRSTEGVFFRQDNLFPYIEGAF